MTQIRDRLAQGENISLEAFVGCTNDEIDSILAQQKVNVIPELYRWFLLLMGKQAGSLFGGSRNFYPELPDLKNEANDILEDCGWPFHLPENAFVFGTHQGYQFLFFVVENQFDDPPVYWYLEQEIGPKVIHEHLSIFFERVIDERLDLVKTARK